MKKEELVASFEPCRKLRELGWPQESLFYWYYSDYGTTHLEDKPSEHEEAWQSVSAFTAGEIILPRDYQIWWNQHAWGPIHGEHYLPGFYSEKTWIFKEMERNREADARVKMLIYLIEHKLIEL